MDVKISRSYARTLEIKKPDGTSLWIKHEASAEALVSSDLSAKAFKDLEEVVMGEVSEAIKTERAKIEASFGQSPAPVDEPFASGPTTTSMLKNLPSL
jgi:hypothetical protein